MAARRRVSWSRNAYANLDEVLAYVAEDSREAAIRVLERALAVADSLATLSERGTVVPEVGDRNIRQLLVHRYRLIYEVRSSGVVILAFIHGARDFAARRRRE